MGWVGDAEPTQTSRVSLRGTRSFQRLTLKHLLFFKCTVHFSDSFARECHFSLHVTMIKNAQDTKYSGCKSIYIYILNTATMTCIKINYSILYFKNTKIYFQENMTSNHKPPLYIGVFNQYLTPFHCLTRPVTNLFWDVLYHDGQYSSKLDDHSHITDKRMTGQGTDRHIC